MPITALRDNIWRYLMEKRRDLSRVLGAAFRSPLRNFTEGDRTEWHKIEQALENEPQRPRQEVPLDMPAFLSKQSS